MNTRNFFKILALLILLNFVKIGSCQELTLGSSGQSNTSKDRFYVRFANPSLVNRDIIIKQNDTIIGVGIPSIDSLNILYSVKAIIKADMNFDDLGPFPGLYMFCFFEAKNNIEEIVSKYLDDPAIIDAEFEYNGPISWRPKDVLFNRCDTRWPPYNPPPNDTDQYYQKSWSQTMDQWSLMNDGTTSDSCGCGLNERSLAISTYLARDIYNPNSDPINYRRLLEAPTEGEPGYPEDISMTQAWSYWFQHTCTSSNEFGQFVFIIKRHFFDKQAFLN